jgi:hypothetical protein
MPHVPCCRFASASALQCAGAIAPVTRQSGGKRLVKRRFSGALFVRQSFHEPNGMRQTVRQHSPKGTAGKRHQWARESVRHSLWAAAYYEQQRAKGCRLHTAVRALAYKWQRIICRCWQDRKPYWEQTYLTAFVRARSPLANKLTPQTNSNDQ